MFNNIQNKNNMLQFALNFKSCDHLYTRGINYLYNHAVKGNFISQAEEKELKNIMHKAMKGEFYNKYSNEYKFVTGIINKILNTTINQSEPLYASIGKRSSKIENSDNDSCYSFDDDWADSCATDALNNPLHKTQNGLPNSSNSTTLATELRQALEEREQNKLQAKIDVIPTTTINQSEPLYASIGKRSSKIENSDNDSCYSFDDDWADSCATDALNNPLHKTQNGLPNSSNRHNLAITLLQIKSEVIEMQRKKAEWKQSAQDKWHTELDVKFEENRHIPLNKIACLKKLISDTDYGYNSSCLVEIQDRISTNSLSMKYTYKNMYQDRKILLKNEIQEVETFLRNKDITKTDKLVLKEMSKQLKKEYEKSLAILDPQNDHVIQEWQKTRSISPDSRLEKISTYGLNQNDCYIESIMI